MFNFVIPLLNDLKRSSTHSSASCVNGGNRNLPVSLRTWEVCGGWHQPSPWLSQDASNSCLKCDSIKCSNSNTEKYPLCLSKGWETKSPQGICSCKTRSHLKTCRSIDTVLFPAAHPHLYPLSFYFRQESQDSPKVSSTFATQSSNLINGFGLIFN